PGLTSARQTTVACSLVRPPNLRLSLGPAHPGGALDRLAGLEVFVHLEEVLDLHPLELGDVVEIADVLLPHVSCGKAHDLVVTAGLVTHPEHPDRTAADETTGKRRLLDQHQGVERIAVFTEGVLDKSVVGRVSGRGEQPSVKLDAPGLVVEFVLVLATGGYLDRHVELHSCLLSS